MSVAEHKDMKGLTSHNLRDHMSEAELIFTALAELSTRQIAESVNATGMPENKSVAKKGGRIAAQARHQLESQTGKSVVLRSVLPRGRRTSPVGEPNRKVCGYWGKLHAAGCDQFNLTAEKGENWADKKV